MRSEDSLTALGAHVIAEFHGAIRLEDSDFLLDVMGKAARAAGATVLQSHAHNFGEGQGITGVVLLAESHITIHTWPEFEYAALDIFMCGEAVDTERSIEVLRQALQPTEHSIKVLLRGRRIGPKEPPVLHSH